MGTIVLVTHSRHDAEARAWRDRALAAWPRTGAGGEASIIMKHAGDCVGPVARLDACVVLHPASIGGQTLSSLAHELREEHVPLVIVGEVGDHGGSVGGAHRWGDCDDAGGAAGFLAGLAARGGTVRQLGESLAYAQSVHESVSRLVEQFQDDQLLAASIQRQFVSQEMPCVDGVSCAAMFRPIDFLSGDIYRVARLDEHHLGFFLADAMGHGLPAALMALYIAGRLVQKEITGREHRIIEPSESIARLNRDLAATGCSSIRYATAVCGVLDLRTRGVRVAAAGHPPAMVLGGGGGGARLIKAGGPLLGVMDDTDYEQASLTLSEGEAIILYSDGLEDTLNPRPASETEAPAERTRHIEFLEQVARDVGGPDPGRMFDRFARMLDSESGSMHQVDDVTLVGVRVGVG